MSFTSTARIILNHQKESKEKKNREKLLANPGSQYSLATQEEMEMDYYDYNVINASAAPGSYLGMDPAFLVWIPPIDEGGKILSDSENEDILPVQSDVEPGSNKESPDEAPKVISKRYPKRSFKSPSTHEEKPINSRLLHSKEITTKINFLHRRENGKPTGDLVLESENLSLRYVKPQTELISQTKEKETAVLKSPSDNKVSEYYELSDIKFADDEEDVDDSSFRDTSFEARC